MGYQRVQITKPLVLLVQLGDGETNLFPRAVVRDSLGAAVSGSPFNLTHVANGLYLNSSFTPIKTGTYYATYFVYTDAGHTILSDYMLASDNFDVGDFGGLSNCKNVTMEVEKIEIEIS